MTNKGQGQKGEQAAAEYLQKQGYRIVARNFTCKTGEIDLICLDSGYLVFVEVKARQGGNMGWPLENVTPDKITHIIRAAQWYMLTKRYTGDVRFDIVCVDTARDKVEHIVNAFTMQDAGRKRHW